MKTKRIWMWSLIFGAFATVIVYVALFTNLTTASTDAQTEVKEVEKPELATAAEETIAKREITNPIVEVSEGMRGISLNVDLAGGVSGYIEPNSYVDVIAYETTIDKEKKEFKSAVLVLQNIKVLTSGKAPDSKEEAFHYETVTLEVTPEQGVTLTLAAKDKDGFYLMLRNNEDETTVKEGLKETRQVYKENE